MAMVKLKQVISIASMTLLLSTNAMYAVRPIVAKAEFTERGNKLDDCDEEIEDADDDSSSDVGDVVSIAESLVGKFKNKYQLGGFDRAIKNYGNGGNIPESASDVNDSKVIDCSTFVSLVMTMAGVSGLDPAPSSSAMATDAKGAHKSFKEVSKSDAKAGDIATSPTHVLILAEDWHGDDTQVISMGDNQGVVKGKFSTYKGASNDITFAEPVGASKTSSSSGSKSSSSSSGSSKTHKKYGFSGLKTDKNSWDKTAKSLAKAIGKAIGLKPELVYAQIYHETGGQMSPPARDNNNFTGITWSSAFPEDWKGQGRGVGEGGNYINFPSLDDYAEVYAETLDNDFGDKKPTTVEEFATALKQKNYFTGPLEDYIAGMKTGVAKYHGLSDVADSADVATTDVDDNSDDECSSGKDDSVVSGDWGWPFADFDPNADVSSPFGPRWGSFHDGTDVGTSTNGGQDILAIHGGKVIKIDHQGSTQNDLGYYVIVDSGDGYQEIYQEFAFTQSEADKAIKVKVGDEVKTGDVIGHLDATSNVTHLHFGVAKGKTIEESLPHSFDASWDAWKDPIKTIQEGLDGGGDSDDGKDTGGDVKARFLKAGGTEDMWKYIVMPESGGNPNAVNELGYRGLGQTKESWGTGSVEKQTKGLINYAKTRYGSIEGAIAFRKSHNWW